MATVTNTLIDESGALLPDIYVEIVLLAPYAVNTQNGSQIIGRIVTRTDSNGVWSLDLIRQADIVPDNSVYRVTHLIPGFPDDVQYFTVPDGGGNLPDLLVEFPDAFPTQASLVQFAPDGGMSSTNVEDAILEAYAHGAGGGGDGTVTAIIPGVGITVDNTDPTQPVVAATGGGGGSTGAGDGDWIAMDVLNGYTMANSTSAGYRKDADGVVHLRGMFNADGSSAVYAVLPEAYRPSQTGIFPCTHAFQSMESVNVYVNYISGEIGSQTGTPMAVVLDGISYPAADAGGGGISFVSDALTFALSVVSSSDTNGLAAGDALGVHFDTPTVTGPNPGDLSYAGSSIHIVWPGVYSITFRGRVIPDTFGDSLTHGWVGFQGDAEMGYHYVPIILDSDNSHAWADGAFQVSTTLTITAAQTVMCFFQASTAEASTVGLDQSYTRLYVQQIARATTG